MLIDATGVPAGGTAENEKTGAGGVVSLGRSPHNAEVEAYVS